uniref:E4 protein n=1 Tax=Human papillomavirus TaxID=10566 RepID=A0A385PL49_9PAPI|nr:MAG: E4 protein [Human papillomavirus]
MEPKYTFYCLKKMLPDLEIVENGLLMLKMNKFPFLPTAALGGLRLERPSLPPLPTLTASRDPLPTLRRPSEEERNRLRRKSLGLPRNHQLSDDDEENKENRVPRNDDEAVSEKQQVSAVVQLLKRLEEAIEQYHEEVYHDLNDFKRRLGIH